MSNYVAFRISEQAFVIEAALIAGILPLQELLPQPRSLPFLGGLLFLGERAVPVIDLHRKLQLSNGMTPKQPMVMILKAPRLEVGIIVDKVHRMLALDEAAFQDGVARVHGRPKRRLLLTDLLSEQEASALEQVSR